MIGRVRSGQERLGQVRTDLDTIGQDSSCQTRRRPGPDRRDQVSTGQMKTGQEMSDQVGTGHDRTDQVGPGQDRTV